MTPALKAAVRAAGVERTAFTAAMLTLAGEDAHADENPVSVLYAALRLTIMRADDLGDDLDHLLIGGAATATAYDANAVPTVVRDLLGYGHDNPDDVLAAALALELSLAAFEASEQAAAMAADLAALADLDGPSAS